ncbi:MULTISPECIES: tetratricopeptide repeat protein [Paenibacillus]|uniref:tetratricopeptide repeat protein n=1 Tax=Paenibacillus TaxID=44249 RepID=UPI002FE38438
MSYWSILGIEATADKALIKKTYARQLKLHHPEEDPQGYQQLREAFEWAMKRAGDLERVGADDEREAGEWNEPTYEEIAVMRQTVFEAEEDFRVPVGTKPHPVQVFFEKMKHLYDDFPRRIDPEAWIALMADDFMWNMAYQDVRVNGLVHFLERHRYMPREVWTILDDSFRPLESKEALYESYDDEVVDYILEQIRGTAELGYECFAGKALDFDIEHYLELRQEAQSAMREDDLVEAEAALTEAAGIFREDPDLQLMRAKLYLRTGRKSEAMASLQGTLDLSPQDREARQLYAQGLFAEGRYEDVLQQCELAREYYTPDQDLLALSAKAKLELGQVQSIWEEYTEARPTWEGFYHFRYNVMLIMLRNPRLYSQESNPNYAELKKMAQKARRWTYVLIMFRLSWLYLFLFALAYFVFDLPPVSLWALPVILGGCGWKTWRTARLSFT